MSSSTRKRIGIVAVVAVACVLMAYPPLSRLAAKDIEPDKAKAMIDAMGSFRKATFDPELASLLALTGLGEMHPKEADRARELESILAKTKTLGIRNAIHLALKDIYRATGDGEKAEGHMRAMLAENDAAMAKAGAR